MTHTQPSNFVPADPSLSAAGITPTPDIYAQKPSQKLHILIVGCGLGGLAAAHCLAHSGHKVTVLESAPAIGEVGAGIQVTPNVTRLLIRWGLKDKLAQIAVKPEAIVFRRYETGERMGYTRWGKRIEKETGAPYYHIHRADFHKLLFDLAEPQIDLRLNSVVVSIDPSAPSVTLKSGEVVTGDLIVGADGVKSMIREVVLGKPIKAEPVGDAAYRAIIPTDLMIQDPELKPFVDVPEMTAWMGPGRHLMAYNIRAKKQFNLVLLHPDDGSVESWSAEGSADKMRADFADYEPRIRKLLCFVESTLKWQLMDRKAFDSWVHPDGKVVLLGDSCHPMLPYRAQGAAMAIEDAAVLGNLFSRISSKDQIKPLLKAYQDLRLERTSNTQVSSRLNRYIFHLPDGPDQEDRDRLMRDAAAAEMRAVLRDEPEVDVWGRDPIADHEKVLAADKGSLESGANEGNPNQWADRKKSATQFNYDADAEVDKWWAEHGKEIS